MCQKNKKLSRFNTILKDYINSIENKAHSEEIHSRLHGLLSEAIRVDITLAELLDILSSSFMGGTTSGFIDNVSLHYVIGAESAKARHDETAARRKK